MHTKCTILHKAAILHDLALAYLRHNQSNDCFVVIRTENTHGSWNWMQCSFYIQIKVKHIPPSPNTPLAGIFRHSL